MKLASLLQEQQQRFEELIELLRREQDLLVQRRAADGPALEALSQSKQRCLSSLESLEQNRRALLASASPESPSDQKDQGAAAAAQSGCLPLWRQVKEQARRARHMNQLNGSLIQQGMRHNRQVLETLHQLRGNPLYDAQGQPGRSGARLQSSA